MQSSMSALQQIAIDLIEQLDLRLGRAAVIAFQSTAEVLVPLSHSHADLSASIRTLAAGGGTQIDLGLLSAQATLAQDTSGRSN